MRKIIYGCFLICMTYACEKDSTLKTADIKSDIGPVDPYVWTQIPPAAPGSSSGTNRAFVINGTAYAFDFSFYETRRFNNTTLLWEPSPIHPLAFFAVINYAFQHGTKVYGLYNQGPGDELYAADMLTGASQQLASFPGIIGSRITWFVIGDKAYAMGGVNGNISNNQLWEYNIPTNTWTNKGVSPLGSRYGSVAIVVGNQAYIGFGRSMSTINGQVISSYKKDWKVYNPATGLAGTLTSFPAAARSYAKGFAMADKIFIGWGTNGADNFNDMWAYDPSDGNWVSKPGCPVPNNGPGSNNINLFRIGNAAYLIGGAGPQFDTWRYSRTSLLPTN